MNTNIVLMQMMDRMCVKVQDHLNSLRFSETSSIQEDMKVAENFMKDARNSKTVRKSWLNKNRLRMFAADAVRFCSSLLWTSGFYSSCFPTFTT